MDFWHEDIYEIGEHYSNLREWVKSQFNTNALSNDSINILASLIYMSQHGDVNGKGEYEMLESPINSTNTEDFDRLGLDLTAEQEHIFQNINETMHEKSIADVVDDILHYSSHYTGVEYGKVGLAHIDEKAEDCDNIRYIALTPMGYKALPKELKKLVWFRPNRGGTFEELIDSYTCIDLVDSLDPIYLLPLAADLSHELRNDRIKLLNSGSVDVGQAIPISLSKLQKLFPLGYSYKGDGLYEGAGFEFTLSEYKIENIKI
jgi:hypothetical protein